MRLALAATLLAMLALPAEAQEVDEKGWLVASARTNLGDGFGLEGEFQARFSNDGGGLYETLQSFFITKELKGGPTIAVGYQRNDTARRHPGTIENRLREQVSGELARLWGGTLSGRVRFEQRFRNDSAETQFRLRPQIAYARPFREGGKTRWQISHESFLASDVDWNAQRGYFRMRNQAGIRTPLVEHVQIDLAYMNQIEFGKEGREDTMDHVGIVSLLLTL